VLYTAKLFWKSIIKSLNGEISDAIKSLPRDIKIFFGKFLSGDFLK